MEAHTCNHPMVAHTVEYLLQSNSTKQPASVVTHFNDLEDADHFAQKIIRQNAGRLTSLKISRADNPAYSCFVWDNPRRDVVDVEKVKLEVDMEPLKSAFETVNQGFKEVRTSIRNLWVVSGAVIVGFTIDTVVRIVS
jgi:hypothetical protein